MRFVGPALLAAGALISVAENAAADPKSFFTVENRDGVWWFVDPASKQLFSLGVNVLSPGAEREHYDPARPGYAAWRYYPTTTAWANEATRRLSRWNFNTVGGWAHHSLQSGPLPYTPVLHLGAEAGAPWNDLFAEAFAEHMDKLAAERVAPHRDDARLLGWFTDNELAWYPETLWAFHLSQPAESATRQAMIAMLRERYHDDFAVLKRDFAPDVSVQSFDDLERGGALPLRAGGRGYDGVSQFVEALADRYYSVVCEAVRRHDPNHLIMGDRYAGFCPDPVARAAGRHVDVVSTNYDWPRGVDGYLPRFYLRRLHALSGKPVLVTEYYAAAAENQSGNPNSGELFVVVADQDERAAVVQTRLKTFADEPGVVGAHWFAYSDEPPHGRPSDGEDYNFGLVDIHDQPYETLTAAMRPAHQEAPRRHRRSGVTAVVAGTPSLEIPLLPAPEKLDEITAGLASHAAVSAGEDGGMADLLVAWNADCIYLTVAGNHYVEASAYPERPPPLSEGLAWNATLEHGREAASFAVRMLDERSEELTGEIEFAYWRRGVRYGATAAVPATSVGADAWHAGDRLKLLCELSEPRSGAATKWEAEIVLAEEPGGVRPEDRPTASHRDETTIR